MTYSRKSAGWVNRLVLNDTVPRVEQEAHLRRIGWIRIGRGLTPRRATQAATWARKSAAAAVTPDPSANRSGRGEPACAGNS